MLCRATLALLAAFAAAAVSAWSVAHADVNSLSQKQKALIDELESRWWGWRYEPSPIFPEPKSWKRWNETWTFSDPAGVVLIMGSNASLQEKYIATMLRQEFQDKHHVACRVVEDLQNTQATDPIVCIGTLDSNPKLAELCQAKGIDQEALRIAEGFAIEFFAEDPARKHRWILLAGSDPTGCIHAGFSLMQLIQRKQEGLTVELCSVRDFPTVKVRSLRGVGESLGMKLQTRAWSEYLNRFVTPQEIHGDELMLPCLDWLARHRINAYHLLTGMKCDARLPDRLSHLVEESHRRGIQVVGGFRPVGGGEGDREQGRSHPCYSSEEDVQKVLGFFRQYMDAGCDFLYLMADDYEPDKLQGHCPKCIDRFGGLAGEQQFMLHRILELAEQRGFPDDRILFCPTHYDTNPGENYLDVFNADPKLSNVQFTFTYLSEETIEERKQAFPNLRYALFFNGPRWLAYYHRAPTRAARALAQHSRNSLYFPIYYGWHCIRYDPGQGWFANATDAVRHDFEVVVPGETAHSTLLGNIANYSDSVFKGPVEYALWGHYGWNPARHDTRQSEIMIGDALFGPRNGTTMAQLNRVLFDLTRVFFEDVPLADDFQATVQDKLALARQLHRQLKSGYHAYRDAVADGYITETQDFYLERGLESIEECIQALERCARHRVLAGDLNVAGPVARYAGVVFPSARPDEFFLSGGAQGDLTDCLNDLYRYSISENRWERLVQNTEPLPPLCGHSAVAVGQQVFLFGGSSRQFDDVRNTLYVYDRETQRYSVVKPTDARSPPPRMVHAACADTEGRMWMFGGLTRGHKDLGDLWTYSPAENRWHEVAGAKGKIPAPRYGSRLACHAGQLYLFGGAHTGAGRLGDFFRFDIESQTWHSLSETPGDAPGPRYAHSFITVKDTIYLFGGGGQPGYLNDLYAYDPAADRWNRMSPRGQVPGPRGCALPVCPDGKRIFFYGGAQPRDSLGIWISGDLYCYDIEQNKFTRLYFHEPW